MKPISLRRAVDLRRGRAHLDRVAAKYPNVVGSMIGLKLRNKEISSEVAFTIFVRQKIRSEGLEESECLPRSVTLNQNEVPTDVIQIGPLMYQGGIFPPNLGTWDGTETGTVACFAKSSEDLFCVTCAHCIAGPDRNPNTPSTVSIWSSSKSDYIPVGDSVIGVSGHGRGVMSDYGFSDVALFSCRDQELRDRAQTAPALRALRLPKFGETVFGFSGAGKRTGRIVGIESHLWSTYADIVVQVDAPGTFRGDSGMLWVNAEGHAVGIHAMGAIGAPGEGSTLTVAMSAGRAEKLLNVTLHASTL